MFHPPYAIGGGHLPPTALFAQDGKGGTGGKYSNCPGIGIGRGLWGSLHRCGKGTGNSDRRGGGGWLVCGRSGRRCFCCRYGRRFRIYRHGFPGRTRRIGCWECCRGGLRCWRGSRCRRWCRRGRRRRRWGRCRRRNGRPQPDLHRCISGCAVDRQLQTAAQFLKVTIQRMVRLPDRNGWGGFRCGFDTGRGGRRGVRSGLDRLHRGWQGRGGRLWLGGRAVACNEQAQHAR